MMTQAEIQAFMEKMHQTGEKGGPTIKPVAFPPIQPPGQGMAIKATLNHFEDVMMEICVELGQAKIKVKELLNLEVGSVIELNKSAGDNADVYLNNKPFARGEVLVLNDFFAVRLNSITRPGKAVGSKK